MMNSKCISDVGCNDELIAQLNKEIDELIGIVADRTLEIKRLRNTLTQYRNDLMYPPSGERRERRIKMVKKLLEGK